jgi:hypothetical protein
MIWPGLVVVISALFAPLFLKELSRNDDPAVKFLVLAIWIRYTIGALSDFTADTLVGPLSLLALYAFLIILTGPFFIKKKLYSHPILWQFFPLFLILFLSTFLNFQFSGILEKAATLVFLMILLLLLFQVFQDHGITHILYLLLLIHLPPLLFLLADLIIGEPIVAPNGARGYYAGYAHNVVPSNIVFSALLIIAFTTWNRATYGFVFSLIALVALNLINYRTTVLGSLPVFILWFFNFFIKTFSKIIGWLLFVVGFLIFIIFIPTISQFVPDIYEEIFIFYQNLGVLGKDPEELYIDELSLFSHRVLFWVQGISMWMESSALHKLIGFGPGAYEAIFGIGAHSGFITFFFDLGIVGLAMLLILLITQAVMSLRIADGWLALRALACTAGYLILNIAAAPLLSVEGAIAFAILVAATWASVDEGVGQRVTGRTVDRVPQTKIGARWQTGLAAKAPSWPRSTAPREYRSTMSDATDSQGDPGEARSRDARTPVRQASRSRRRTLRQPPSR